MDLSSPFSQIALTCLLMAELRASPVIVKPGIFFCQFCLEDRPLDTGATLPCGHRFDSSCLAAWVAARVVEGKTTFHCQYDSTGEGASPNQFEILPRITSALSSSASPATVFTPPPGPPGICNRLIPRREIDEILGQSPDIRSKYHRFLAQAANPNLRQCPTCGLSQSGTAANPAITCSGCGQIYCFLHSNAHIGSTCAGALIYVLVCVGGWEGRQGRQYEPLPLGASLQRMSKLRPRSRD